MVHVATTDQHRYTVRIEGIEAPNTGNHFGYHPNGQFAGNPTVYPNMDIIGEWETDDLLQKQEDVSNPISFVQAIAMAICHYVVGDPFAVNVRGEHRWTWFRLDAQHFIKIYGYRLKHFTQNEIGLLTKESSESKPVARQVKLLEWEMIDGAYYSARGGFKIVTNGIGWGVCQADFPYFGVFEYPTIAAAKAAAQAEHDRYVLSMLVQ